MIEFTLLYTSIMLDASLKQYLCNENVFNTARDVSCHTASGKTADPAESGWVRSLARAFPFQTNNVSTIYSYFLQPSEKKGKERVSYATMKNLNASKDDNPVVSIYILLSIVLVFSFLGTFLDSSGERSPKAAVSERS